MTYRPIFANLAAALVMYTRLLRLTATILFALLPAAVGRADARIYVYSAPDGSIKFTSKPPPPGITARLFTAHQAGSTAIRARVAGRGAPREAYTDLITAAARRHRLNPHLLRSMIATESAFNPYAVSNRGALGLMQLLPDVARSLGVRDAFLPWENIEAGSRHMSSLLKKYRGNLVLALSAYNAGESAVERYGGVPPFSETREYIRRVVRLMEEYRLKAPKS